MTQEATPLDKEAKQPQKTIDKEARKAALLKKKEELLAKQLKIEARIKALEITPEEKRKLDTRRKVIAGGVILSLIKTDEEIKAKFLEVLKPTLKRDCDKLLFTDLIE